MTVILDLETDGLMPYCTKIHCAVAYDIETATTTCFTPANIHTLPDYLDTVTSLSMHNGIGFDFKVLKKIFNYEYEGEYTDTLLMSQILWPDIEPAKYISGYNKKIIEPCLINEEGVVIQYEKSISEPKFAQKTGHSVEAWGMRLGISKPVHEDWSVYTPEMLHRCEEDVKIQTALYKKCVDTVNAYKLKDRRLSRWDFILDMEQEFWVGMEKQAENGWLLDVDLVDKYIKQLTGDLSKIDTELDKILPYVVKKPYKDKAVQAFKKDGTLTTNANNWLMHQFVQTGRKCTIGGDFSRVEFEKLNLNSPVQLKDFLLKEGWMPKTYNFKTDGHNKPIRDEKRNLIYTTPKIPKTPEEWEQVAHETASPAITVLTNRSKINHRLSLMKGFLETVRPDRRIEAKMFSCGTNTARARHEGVVNIPRADDGSFFGKECRSVFTVPEGKILVGVDASALEARCEAHYLYKIDTQAADLLIHADIHILNSRIWNVTRSLAKSGKYALTYGCGVNKLAATLCKPSEMGKQLYDDFWDGNPALKELKRLLEQQFESKGYLVAVDGRPLSIRYNYALLNTLLQAAGAIAMKHAWCIFNKWRVKERLEDLVLDVGNFHDELQVETTPELATAVGEQVVESIRLAGELLRFNVPLTGEFKIGNSWSSTH